MSTVLGIYQIIVSIDAEVRNWKSVKWERSKGGIYDQAVGSGMEGYECAVGGGATDDNAVDPLFPGDNGLDETYDHDFFEANGRERCSSV